MNAQTRSHAIYGLLPAEVEGFDSLAELALDMRWTWNHATDEAWRQLEAVRVELYADGANGAAPERVEMKRVRQLVGATNGYNYRAGVPAARAASDYTARLIPHRDGVAVPLEIGPILWQR